MSNAILEIKEVSKTLSNPDNSICISLLDLNMVCKPGVTGVFGDRGSGKTILAKIAAGMIIPDLGHVYLKSIDLTSLTKKNRNFLCRSNITYLSEDANHLRGLTVTDHVMLSLGAKREPGTSDLIQELFEVVNYQGRKNMQTELLSNIDKQKIDIVRGLLLKPDLIISDSADAQVQEKEKSTFWRLLKRVAVKFHIPVIIFTSSSGAIEYCDQHYFLSDGKLSKFVSTDISEQVSALNNYLLVGKK